MLHMLVECWRIVSTPPNTSDTLPYEMMGYILIVISTYTVNCHNENFLLKEIGCTE